MKNNKILSIIILFCVFTGYSTYAEVKTKAVDSTQVKGTTLVKRSGIKPTINGYSPKEGVDLDVQYKNGKLLVYASGKTAKEVFSEIAKAAKIEIIVDEETGKRKTSLMIKDKNLKEGIENILYGGRMGDVVFYNN